MTFEEYFKNEKLYKSLADEINTNAKMLSSFQSAIEQVSSVSKYRELLGIKDDSLSSAGASLARLSDMKSGISKLLPANSFQTAVVGSAFQDNFKFNGAANLLRAVYEPLFEQQRMLENTQSSVRAIIEAESSFADRLKTNVYIKKSPVEDAVSGVGAALAEVNKSYGKSMFPGAVAGLSTLQTALTGIDKNYDGARLAVEQVATAGQRISELLSPSWLREDSPWKIAIGKLTNFGLDRVQADSPLIRLINAESETGRLLGQTRIDTSVTSAAAQLASIVESENTVKSSGIIDLITGFNKFALDQHKLIQAALDAGRDRDAEWRLDLLESTSKFVDRQVIQESRISEQIEDIIDINDNTTDSIDYQSLEKDYDNYEPIDQDNLVLFSLIPQEIGYSNREKSRVSQKEAFENSNVVKITELGFGIVNRILRVNELQRILYQDNVFRATDKNMWTIGMLGQFICDDSVKFETLMKSIYSLIYENQNGIKKMLGDGDSEVGNEIIKGDDFKCIFRIKDIRTDLEHDIQHGKDKDQRKKQKEIDEAYQFYFKKKKPSTAREFKTFQINLYQDIISLIDHFIEIIEERVRKGEEEAEDD